TLSASAAFVNEDTALYPNQFVNVCRKLQTLSSVIPIPSDAVQFGSRGTYGYLVNPDEIRAYSRVITLGASADGRVAVVEGLGEGDLVVLEGLDRLRDGREVVISERDGE